MTIQSIAAAQIPQLTATINAPGAAAANSDFSQILKATINQVEQSNRTANEAVGRFLSGEEGELHTTVLATQKADLQFEMFMQVRNKVVGAYQEIMRMQL